MEKSGLSLTMLSHAYMLYTQWVDAGYGDMDVSAIAKVV
jgi:3-hydroxyisobutyrate dehydrogenase-like beta-hydroxyacid dehydrogenase